MATWRLPVQYQFREYGFMGCAALSFISIIAAKAKEEVEPI
jgi:hypothetical protein